ncbi:MAG: potassium/proton antiporter [Roseiflexaceae bacterium]
MLTGVSFEAILAIVSGLLLLSILASRLSSRTGVPALLLFLAIGMLAGSDGPGQIAFDNPQLTQSVGVIALVLILFSGGLDTDWGRVRPVLAPSLTLANVGVLVCAGLVGGFAAWVLGFGILEGMLLGAIISSTDAAAVFSVMRSRDVRLKDDLEPVIEFESGSNDPIAVFLTIGLISLITTPGSSILSLIPQFVLQMGIGAVTGIGMGRMMAFVVNRLRLQEGIYPVATLALVLLTYGGTSLIGGNGFLAVYLAGLTLGNRDFLHKRSLMRFHDGMAWLMQIAMFLTLGLQVYPSRLPPVAIDGLMLSAFLIFVARPVSVFVALAPFRFSTAAKLMISWTGLRGAVPIVMATYPLLAGIDRADAIFHLVFFVVLTSVLLQGTTIPMIAKWLKLQDSRGHLFHYPQEFVPSVTMRSQLIELRVAKGSTAEGSALMELGLPRGALVVAVTREGEGLIPEGSMVFEAEDRVLVLGDREVLEGLPKLFASGGGAAA